MYNEGLIDKAGKLIKAGVDSFVPGGAIATELLFSLIKMPCQKRSEAWQQEITDAINKIQDKGVNIEQLQNNEEFIDILLQSIPIGLKHHQEEKKRALKNAIIHSAQKNAPDFSLQQIFLNCIDTFTIWHIKILTLFNNPQKWFENNENSLPGIGGIGSVRGTLEKAFPELRDSKDLVDNIWTDLYNRGFVSGDKNLLQTTMTSQGSLEKRTTKLGDQFIAYIEDE
ncbi:TPA: hypothetical protein JAN90_11710 [Legionella pneumophila]|uniref:hypothetical protein n=1 Tax=Legionella sp. PATHC039 TaxID=2992042 RepID=UPI0007788AF6|nr:MULTISPECIES: hypothetical protein [Legionella]HAT8859434.1 hypothetical protein [Legionella pneumophila subsp. pneumophila]MCW8396281.1 hypothetical protein [Legionella sp. PATHC039]HAT7073410.1 hypothetical protein [Legionella pneumophila]HAT8642849.1 hypothetical protein [Legionella pneumophila]HAT8869275.1 hypothetical protein [Legionella pneumophila subsp. pneumophila]